MAIFPATLLKKETPTQVFSCEYCKIFKNSFFYRPHSLASSELYIRIRFISYGLRSLDQITKFAIYLFCRSLLYSLSFNRIKRCYAKMTCAIIYTVNYHRNHTRNGLHLFYKTIRDLLYFESLLLDDEYCTYRKTKFKKKIKGSTCSPCKEDLCFELQSLSVIFIQLLSFRVLFLFK